MELLRIVAMVLVLVFHANFMGLGKPTVADVASMPVASFARYFIQSLSQVCVNLFVLVSGWYAIKFKMKSLCKLLFQVIFFSLLVWIVLYVYCPERYLNIESLSTIILFNSSDYWFIKAYIGLMILSPALNLMVESFSEKQLRYFLILFYVFQTIYGWLNIYGAEWIEGGYSVWSFIGLYLLARYARLYPLRIFQKSSMHDFLCYVLIALFLAFMAFVMSYLEYDVAGRFVSSYTNPLSIIEAVFLLLAFSKLHFESRLINWISSSCLAVYLLHANELVLRTYYGPFIKWIYNNNTMTMFLLYTIAFILAVFTVSILIDKIRMYCWNKICNRWGYCRN